MERQVRLEDISDGKFYDINDMVKAGCNDCKGCSACCQNMGNSIILDPLDVYRLSAGLNCTFEDLLADKLDLNVVEGIILPNLKMVGMNKRCVFLNTEGRCSVHDIRPGMCRIFPLGRFYENGDYRYFLQVEECTRQNRTKVKVKKWIDTPDIGKNHTFINQWHYFLKRVSGKLPSLSEEAVKKINMYILNAFFVILYQERRDFYEQFEERMSMAQKNIDDLIGGETKRQ